MPPDDLLDIFEIDTEAWPPEEDELYEPVLLSAPFLVEFDDLERLDPERAIDEPEEPVASPQTRGPPVGTLFSLGLHLLPLLLLLGWQTTPTGDAPPMAVQLVYEKPAETPEPPSEQQQPGPLSSANREPSTEKPPPTHAPEKTPRKQLAAITPPKAMSPSPPRPPTHAEATPVPAKPPRPASHPETAPARPTSATPAAAAIHFPGPTATRDEYLAYLVTLTRPHFSLLPLSMLSGRHGVTVVSIQLLDDGTITHIGIAESSGYPDIDQRVTQMVAAVRRFPPLPQWFKGPLVELNLRFRFPEALEH